MNHHHYHYEVARWLRCWWQLMWLWRTVIVMGSAATTAVQLENTFPSLETVLDMSSLSLLVYRFVNETNDSVVCDEINSGQVDYNDTSFFPRNFYIMDDLTCHWYYHDRKNQGTQLMIVSSVSPLRRYVAVVFAGTDDYQTALLDMDLLQRKFGDDNGTWTLDNNDEDDAAENVRVHAGFDNAVFANDLFDSIVEKVESVRQELLNHDNNNNSKNDVKIYTTGHSLGAAAAILTAVGLDMYYFQNKYSNIKPPAMISTINFGCPCIGNQAWRDYLHKENSSHPFHNRLAIWRIVLGWDLVPRLPGLFYHVGHTVQLSWGKNKKSVSLLSSSSSLSTQRPREQEQKWEQGTRISLLKEEERRIQEEQEYPKGMSTFSSKPMWRLWTNIKHWLWPVNYQDQIGGSDYETINTNEDMIPSSYWWSNPDDDPTNSTTFDGTVLAYYQHYGDGGKHYAAVPLGWSGLPFIWLPGALASHHAIRYWQFLYNFRHQQQPWVSGFVPFSPDNTDDHMPNVQDDFYVDPPDDDSFLQN